jgi:hypothetical protein
MCGGYPGTPNCNCINAGLGGYIIPGCVWCGGTAFAGAMIGLNIGTPPRPRPWEGCTPLGCCGMGPFVIGGGGPPYMPGGYNHLVREWRWDGTHHRSWGLTRWSRALVYLYPHWLWMHVWRSMTIDHHPTRNWTTLRVHHWSGSGRVARQRRRVRRSITRTVALLLTRRLSRQVVLSFRWGGYGRR